MSSNAKTLSPLRVILVSSDAHLRGLLRSQLYALELTDIFDAVDGAEAIEKIRELRPGLIICTLALPPDNGICLTHHLRWAEDSPNPYIPIMLLAGASDHGRLREALDAGVSAVLTIPFTAEAFRTHLVELIEHPKPYIRTKTYFGPERRLCVRTQPAGELDRRTKGR